MKELNLALSLLKAEYVVAKKFDRLSYHGLGLSEFMLLMYFTIVLGSNAAE